MKIIAFICFAFAALCAAIANSGDNVDAKATAGILYIPAFGFAGLGAVLLLLSLIF